MSRQKLTTDQVEAYYRAHPGDRSGTGFPLWLKAVLAVAGAVIVLGVVLAFAG